jgi:hypothetical protein
MKEWLILYSLLIAALAAMTGLFISVKRETRLTAVRSRKRMDEIVARLEEAHKREPEPVFFVPPVRSGLNMSKRVQAVRMLRRNEDVSHVAAALGVTRREIELLIRVHQIGLGARKTV